MKRTIMATISAIAILGTAGSLADGRPGVVFSFLAVFVAIGGVLALIMTGWDERSSRPAAPMTQEKRMGRKSRCGLCAARLEPIGGMQMCPSCDGVTSRTGRPY